MSDHPRMQSLKAKHRQLDEQITQEQSHPAADPYKIASLKREKLALKEQMTSFS